MTPEVIENTVCRFDDLRTENIPRVAARISFPAGLIHRPICNGTFLRPIDHAMRQFYREIGRRFDDDKVDAEKVDTSGRSSERNVKTTPERDRPPVEEPPNAPRRPPMKEPEEPPKPSPDRRKEPPVEEPPNRPPEPPLKEPPKDPNRKTSDSPPPGE